MINLTKECWLLLTDFHWHRTTKQFVPIVTNNKKIWSNPKECIEEYEQAIRDCYNEFGDKREGNRILFEEEHVVDTVFVTALLNGKPIEMFSIHIEEGEHESFK